MLLLLVYVVLALAVSFLCSLLEAVLLSITPAYVAMLEEQRSPAAERLRALKANIDRPLAAILSLNTVAHTIGAAGAGAQAAMVFGSAAVGVFSAILTLLILVLSEIIPKTLGAVHWKRLAPYVAPVLQWMVLGLYPLVKLAEWLTRLLTPREREAQVSREELAAMATEGEREGVVEAGESRVMHNLLRLRRLCVRNVMTPAEHVVSLCADMNVREAMEGRQELHFSRVPLYTERGGVRRYEHYALKDEILAALARDEDRTPVRSLGRELLAVPEDLPLTTVFDEMTERREHVALAVNRRGEMTGVITMEDILETLLGVEIFDEVDDEERIHELARSHWEERAKRLGRVTDVGDGEMRLGITGSGAAAPEAPARRAS